ncbi:recombinase RecT, partial [Duncaniella muris]|uniref:recombinase RecT n=5 Tax=Bacteroidales TaxID=171549 RepID=UPI0025A21ECC
VLNGVNQHDICLIPCLNILKFEVEIIQKHLTVQMYDMTVEQMANHAKRYSKAITSDKDVTVEKLLNLANLPVSLDSNKVGWMGNFHGMAQKTVIRNLLSKYGYLSVEMQNAITNDYEGDETSQREILTDNYANKQLIDAEDVSFESVSSEQQMETIDPGY